MTGIPRAALALPGLQSAPPIPDVTVQTVLLGTPFSSQCHYARNVWDMQSFAGKLYLGSGNSGNNPCGNAGPIGIVAYDPTTSSFATEYTAATEQIDRFVVLNGQLVIPSHDPRGPDELAIFRKGAVSWTKQTGSAPSTVVHTYDLANFAGSLFAGVGGVYASVFISSDGGATWQAGNSSVLDRGYALFQLGGKLYLAEDFGTFSTVTPALYEYSGGTTFTALPGIQFAQMFPAASTSGILSGKLQRATNYLSQLVYIGASTVNDHQGDPMGLYTMASIGAATRISLPNGAKPYDILVGSDGALYVLGSVANGDGTYRNSVTRTADLTTWTEQFYFTTSTFARSFEYLNAAWYFGLGQDHTTSITAAGSILRYTPAMTSTPTPTQVPIATPLPTATYTATPLPTATYTATPLPTATYTATPLPTATYTATPLPTATYTATPLPTATYTATPLPTATYTATPLPT
ncbi:MAG: hypothetical protein ACKVVP_01820, partial [Chloroflexota bacterium]